MLLFSFLRNSFMHFRILLFPFEFYYSLFWFYYAIMHSLIQFPILLFAFEFCYAVFQFYNLIVQSSHAVSNPTISFEILIFTFLILLAYAIIIRFRILCSSKLAWTSFIWRSVPWGPVSNWWNIADLDDDVLRNRLRVWVNAILQHLHSPSFDSDSHDSVFYSVENRLGLSLGQLRHNASFNRLLSYRYYSKNESQIRVQMTNKTVVIMSASLQ